MASPGRRPRVGLLDLDIFGPSVPRLLGLSHAPEPDLTPTGALIPLRSHGLKTMSIGFLLAPSALPREVAPGEDESGTEDTPIVWRGLMVMKAVQQLLFDVDWRAPESLSVPSDAPVDPHAGLDVLVIDTPPGTGDVLLSLTQLVEIDASVVVSTPQYVALLDARRGLALMRKTGVPEPGLLLNMAHLAPPGGAAPIEVFGPSKPFNDLAARLRAPVLGRLPLEPDLAATADAGTPLALQLLHPGTATESARSFGHVAKEVWKLLAHNKLRQR